MPSPCPASKNALYTVPAGADSVRAEILDLRVTMGLLKCPGRWQYSIRWMVMELA
jgi:hypothetical protein